MEIITPNNRITDIFQYNKNYWTATVSIDETYAQVFKFDHEPTPEECDEYAEIHIENIRLQKLQEEIDGNAISE